MPHVIVKLRSGKSEELKTQLPDAITEEVMTVLNHSEEAVSVALEEIQPPDWTEKVYEPDIKAKWKNLYKKPGYTPVE